jgi:2-keto-4-pentenoate hydratase/2-oxohepta-3-ene-1,7-dioic acid hydratase in catechol pathway
VRLIMSVGPGLPGVERPGAVVTAPDGTDRVLDLRDVTGCSDVTRIVADPTALAAARAAVAGTEAGETAATLPRLDEVHLAPPVRPRTLLCLGYAYRGHLQDDAPPRYPNVFVKTAGTVGGPQDPVRLPHAAHDVDYEGEIAVVIGRTAHEVAEADALAHVAGYTLLNDVSDRGWQHRGDQWALGKSFDGFAPIGPWLVTTDEVPDLRGRSVEVERDGVVTVHASTDALIWSVPFLVAYLSQVMTLEAGDVISTGTPGRTPAAQAVHTPLAHGDAVTVRVTGLGALTTTVVSMEDPA